MKKINLFLLFLIFGFVGTIYGQTTSKQKLAVYVGGNGDDAVKKVIGAKLTSAIANNSNYIAVERTEDFLYQLRNELFYQRTKKVDEKQIADFGRQMGVQAVCIAEVTKDVFGEYFVSARILDVNTALVTAAAQDYANLKDMSGTVAFSEKLANSLCSNIGYELGDCTKLAVYVGGDGGDGIKRVIGSHLVSAIIGNGYYSAVERTNAFLAQLAKEDDYGKTRNVRDDELIKWGKQFGANVVCVADITEGFGSFFVSVRLIDVTSGQILYTAESERKLTSMSGVATLASDVSNQLMKKIVTCTKENKEIRYCNNCCDGLENKNGVCVPNTTEQIKRNVGLEIRVRHNVSWNNRSNCDYGYRLATDTDLIEIGEQVLNQLFRNIDYNNILTSNSCIVNENIRKYKSGSVAGMVVGGVLAIWSLGLLSPMMVDQIPNNTYSYELSIRCWNKQEKISSVWYEKKKEVEIHGRNECMNQEVFTCIDVKIR